MLYQLPNQDAKPNAFSNVRPEPTVIDSEYLIRHAFAQEVSHGYKVLFRRYYSVLCSQAVRFVHSREIAEDIVGEVFFTFWKNQVHLRITTSFRAYLFSAVRKRAYSHLQDEFRLDTLTDALSGSSQALTATNDPQQILQYTELHHRIEEAVRALPPQCQRVFVMSRFDGKKHREIADELHLSLKTIEAHLAKALVHLRRILQRG